MKKSMKARTVWDAVQGARSAKTGMYVVIHEDFEHALIEQVVTPQCAQNVGFARF